MGAHLGSSLAQSVARVLSVIQRQMIFSVDVLRWIRGYGRMYNPFVLQWRYVPTNINPADYLTRGLQISKLIELKS